MSTDVRFAPMVVVVPPRVGNTPQIVSRPLLRSRISASPDLGWVAVAIGAFGSDWVLAPRAGPSQSELILAIQYAEAASAALPYAWQVEREEGWIRKTPSILRGAVAPAGLPPLPPTLVGDLALSLLLNPRALFEATNLLGNLTLLAAVRNRNELLVASAGDMDPFRPLSLLKYVRQTGQFGPIAVDFVFHVNPFLQEGGPITGITRPDGESWYYSNAVPDRSAWLIGNEGPAPGDPPVVRINLDEHQIAILALLRREGRAHWRAIGQQIPERPGVKFFDEMAVLEAQGLVQVVHRDGPNVAWSLTKIGEGIVGGLREVGVAPSEVEELTNALRGGTMSAIHVLIPLLKTPERLAELLRSILQAEPALTGAVVNATLMLDNGMHRDMLWGEVLSDARPEVRVACLSALAPGEVEKPGKVKPALSEARVDEAIRLGLADGHPKARELAARLAYATGRVAGAAHRLGQMLEDAAEDREARYWAALALGCVSDSLSLPLLLKSTEIEDDRVAGAAAVALCLRSDGRQAWFRLLESPRAAVREAAVHALRKVVTGLPDAEVERLQAHPSEEVRAAAKKYVLRRGRRPA